MEDEVVDAHRDDAVRWQAPGVQPPGDIMHKLHQAPVADQADAGPWHADRGNRRLALRLKQDRINNVHWLSSFLALFDRAPDGSARSDPADITCPPSRPP